MRYQGETRDVSKRPSLYQAEDFGVGCATVLGLGCAEGYDEIWIAKHYHVPCFGIDINPEAIANAKSDAEKAGVRGGIAFLCMDAAQLLIMENRLPPVSVLLLNGVCRWIGPDPLGAITRLLHPFVIYCESHSTNDEWTREYLYNLPANYHEPIEIARLPYTIADPRPIRILYRIERKPAS